MRLTDFKFVNKDNELLLQEEWAPLKTAYDRFARSYSGMLIRESMRWGRLRMTSGSLPYVFVAGDPVKPTLSCESPQREIRMS
jgi:predicted acetyltransferase